MRVTDAGAQTEENRDPVFLREVQGGPKEIQTLLGIGWLDEGKFRELGVEAIILFVLG